MENILSPSSSSCWKQWNIYSDSSQSSSRSSRGGRKLYLLHIWCLLPAGCLHAVSGESLILSLSLNSLQRSRWNWAIKTGNQRVSTAVQTWTRSVTSTSTTRRPRGKAPWRSRSWWRKQRNRRETGRARLHPSGISRISKKDKRFRW